VLYVICGLSGEKRPKSITFII